GSLEFFFVDAPDWMSVDALTGLVSGDTTGHPGVLSVTFGVRDPDGLTDMITLTVDVNARPELEIDDLTLVRGDELGHGVRVSDADTPFASLVFRLLAGPDWISIDPATGRITGDTLGKTGAS